MNKKTKRISSLHCYDYLALVSMLVCGTASASTFDTLSDGEAWADFRLRYEHVDQDNVQQTASALTLRTQFGVKSGELNGFSALLEGEDSRTVFGVDDYSVGPTGFKVGEYPVIADPETTEVDQALLQYKNSSWLIKAGRQVIKIDNQRFVGDVGWRQDRQTFDGITFNKQLGESVSVYYGYLSQRNRIFAEDADIDSNDHLIHLNYDSGFGDFKAYGYLLETDSQIDNGLDTWGLSYKNSFKSEQVTWLVGAEFATQKNEVGEESFDADYINANIAAKFKLLTLSVGYEQLGSDNGGYGFATPLATLHKFNGWADQFLTTPGQGLKDTYVSIDSQFANGKWKLVWHEYSADQSSSSVDDFGSELNIQYVTKVFDRVSVGTKYAQYFAKDIKSDTSKVWLWLSTRF